MNTVVQEVNLSATAQLTKNCVTNDSIRVFYNMGLYRQTFLRRRFQYTHITNAYHGHMQRPGNGRSRQRQHIHFIFHVLDNFLVRYAETLLFVNNQQPQIFEMHILCQQAMRAN